MPPATIKLGKQAGEHGSYAFYRSFSYMGRGKWRNVRLGKFFFVRLSKDSPICIGELQLVWTGRYSSHPLASIRLFYLPEQLPDGRQSHHGQDELVSTEKMVLHVKDLIKWIIYDGVEWSLGLSLPKGGKANNCTCRKASDGLNCNVQIIDFTSYCRLRTALKRAEGKSFWDIVRSAQLVALYGLKAIKANHYIMFCKETFECPELENHDYRCDHLAPNLKGRPRKKGKGRKGKHTTVSSNASNTSSSTTTTPAAEVEVEPTEANDTVDPDKDKEKYEKILKQALSSKEYFTKTLYKYMKEQGTPITKIPSLGFKQVDLHLFFTHAHSVGGYKEICRKRLWKHLYDRMGGIPHNTSAATCTKRQYERLLLSFEKHVVRSAVASKGVLPASQMNKLKKMNMAVVPRWHRKPSAASSSTGKCLDTSSNEPAACSEIGTKMTSDKTDIDDSFDEDQIPLSKLKSECKEVSSTKDIVLGKTVWENQQAQSMFSSENDGNQPAGEIGASTSFTTCPSGSNPLISTVASTMAGTTVAESLSSGASATDTQVTMSRLISAQAPQRPVIRPAHCMVKAYRPLNILGPCHPNLLTAAQRSPWTINVKKRYADPKVVPTAQGHPPISELKHSMSDEVLDLSAKRQKMSQPTHSGIKKDHYASVDDCGAIDLTMSRDRPLALVKVKSESITPWKIQEEPLNFSKGPKPFDHGAMRQQPPPPLLQRELVGRSSSSASFQSEPQTSSIAHGSGSYPVNTAVPATAYLLSLPKLPSYSSAAPSMYTERFPGNFAMSRGSPMTQLQVDLARDSTKSSNNSSRFLSPGNIRPQTVLSAPTGVRHSHPALSSRMPSSAHSTISRHNEPPPKYGDHHRRVELAYEAPRHHTATITADGRHGSESKPRAPLNQLSIPRVRDVSPGRDGRLLSPQNTAARIAERMPSPNQHNAARTQLQSNKDREPSQVPPFLQHHLPLKPHDDRQGSMLINPRQLTTLAGQMQQMQAMSASFDQRRIDSAHRSSSNAALAHKINSKPPTLAGKMTPTASQLAMAHRQRPISTASSYMPIGVSLNQRQVPTAHSHKSSSLSPKQPQPIPYGSSGHPHYQDRQQNMPVGPHMEYPRYAMLRQPPTTSSMPMPQPLQRLPTSLNAHASITSSLPAPPRLQPIPKHQYPPHSSAKQMYKQ